MVKRYQ